MSKPRPRPTPSRFQPRWTFVLLPLLALGSIGAAEIHLVDGNILTGEVVAESEDKITIVIETGTSTAKLTLDRKRVHEIKDDSDQVAMWNVPEGESLKPTERPHDATVYLEVPIGKLGIDTYAKGLSDVMVYARRQGIEHIVFVIDSNGSWDLDEARRCFAVLQKFRNLISFHAVVKNCLGDALAVAMNCHTFHLMPGGRLGGIPLGEESDEDRVMRSAVARRAAEAMRSMGRSGDGVRAMIDPELSMVFYRNADGDIRTASQPPADLKPEDVIVRVGKGELLVLDEEIFRKIGHDTFIQNVEDLGKELGIDGFHEAGGYGERQMARVAERENKRKARDDAKLQSRITRTEERRDTAAGELQHSIAQAKEWDPTNGDYSTYETYTSRGNWYRGRSGNRRSGWGWSNRGTKNYYSGGGSTTDTKVMTKGSREEWKLRSQNCVAFLDEALRAARSLKKLETDAARLGLEAMFSENELDLMIKDLEAKRHFVYSQRNRKEK